MDQRYTVMMQSPYTGKHLRMGTYSDAAATIARLNYLYSRCPHIEIWIEAVS